MSSMIYRFIVAIRNFAYDHGWMRSTKLPVPVISIGNIAVGGTGKTPLVHLLAIRLQDQIKLAILTRGFRSEMERMGKCEQISKGKGSLYSPKNCGDEPYLLAQKTKASIWVGANRVVSGFHAIKKGADCLLLDDGMQHRRLHRDVEIVILDGMDPFSNYKFLPSGLLRDSPKRMKAADLIVFTHVKDQEHYQQLQKQIIDFTKAPTVAVQIDVLNKHAFASRKVGIFCGIGNPAYFLQTVRDLNQEIIDTLILKDHGCLEKQQLQKFSEKCRIQGAEALLCTEKDYIKLSKGTFTCLKIEPVEIHLKIIAGNKNWENMINNILDRMIK